MPLFSICSDHWSSFKLSSIFFRVRLNYLNVVISHCNVRETLVKVANSNNL